MRRTHGARANYVLNFSVLAAGLAVTFTLLTSADSLETTRVTNASYDAICSSAGQKFGESTATATLNQCYQIASANVKNNRRLYTSSMSGGLKVIGYKNLIYLQRGTTLTIISGEMSKLSDIDYLALSPDEASIAVLNRYVDSKGAKRQELLFFKASQNGNVVPYSVNSDSSMDQARSVSFSPAGDSVLVPLEPKLASEAAEIASFKVNEDSRSALADKQPHKQVVLSSVVTMMREPTSAVSRADQMIISDRTFGVRAFDMTKKIPALVWELKAADARLKGLIDYDHLFAFGKAKALYVIDSVGHFAKLPD